MKRVKIMLMAICLVAVAGGVLAFKAMDLRSFCTTATITTQVGGDPTCPSLCPNITTTATDPEVGVLICTAPTTVGTNGNSACTYTTDPPGTVTLTTVTQSCVATARRTAEE